MARQSMSGRVCIVTGATRGIGKGIALQLGEAGATVYITTLTPPSGDVGGSLEETEREIRARGGICIPVRCDHSKDSEVEDLFERVDKEQNGRLDLLVNNAFSATKAFTSTMDKNFWEMKPSSWDEYNDVGLRNVYFCSVYAARMMVRRRQGLIVNVSSIGGLIYLHNVPYSVGKEACDRMAVDCALELKKHNVAFVSLWPDQVWTEEVVAKRNSGQLNSMIETNLENAESTEFSGKCVVSLATDPNIMAKSGRVLMNPDLAIEYGVIQMEETLSVPEV